VYLCFGALPCCALLRCLAVLCCAAWLCFAALPGCALLRCLAAVPCGVSHVSAGGSEAPLQVQGGRGAAVQEQPAHAGVRLRRGTVTPRDAPQHMEGGEWGGGSSHAALSCCRPKYRRLNASSSCSRVMVVCSSCIVCGCRHDGGSCAGASGHQELRLPSVCM
jgi:hypothetical protein